jgi:AcrR family transcriptional regulator
MMARKLSPEKREQFLKSALTLFVANGIKNTSTNAIAKDAGTAAGTLFLYFPTKGDLINELVLQISKEQSETIKTQLNPAMTVRETFFTIWDGSIGWFLEHMEAYQYIRQVRDSGLIADEVVGQTAKDLDYYFIAIQRGSEEGAIKDYPLELIGTVLYQNIVAVMNLTLAEPDPEKQVAYKQSGFQIFWDGIKADG